MPYTPRPWPAPAHEPLAKLDENLWSVSVRLPRGPMSRRMAIVRLSDGRLLFHNTVPLAEPAMREIEAFGRPAMLVVPTAFHRLGVREWKARYPDLRVICPAEARAHLSEAVPVDGNWEALPRDPVLAATPLPGSRAGEAVLVVRSAAGARTSLLFGDTVMNIPHRSGLAGLALRLLGSSGGPRVTPTARLLTIRDAKAVAGALVRLAGTPGLARLVPSHGEVVTERAADVLREVARRLCPAVAARDAREHHGAQESASGASEPAASEPAASGHVRPGTTTPQPPRSGRPPARAPSPDGAAGREGPSR